MMKFYKRLMCLVLALAVMLVSTPCAFAKEDDDCVVDADSLTEYGDAVADLIAEQKESTDFDKEEAMENDYYSCRIIVKSDYIKDIDLEKFEPKAIVYNEDNDQAVVQFETEEQTKTCLEALKLNDKVEYAEPDTMMKIQALDERKIFSATENMRNEILSWGVNYSHAGTFVDELVAQGNTTPVTVSVVDTGADLDHPYLSGRLRDDGYDFAYGDNNPNDGDGHGTHVSGTIVDVTGDLNVKILPVKVLEDDGGGYTSAIANGIRYAVNCGAQVINMSLGGGHDGGALEEAIDYAISKGVVVCVAAGNESTLADYSCPAHYSPAICVSAIDSNSRLADFSNYGNYIDFAAPGVNVYSSYTGGQYATLSGTSMATPHVSAYAAILRALYPGYTPSQIEQKMRDICNNIGNSYYFGYGTVDFNNHEGLHTHVAGDWEWFNDPTCTEQGRNVKKCLTCGCIMETEYIPALGHIFETGTVAPTCTEDGYDKNECSRCHAIEKSNFVPALGHDMAEPVMIRPVSCTQNGTRREACKRCDYHVDTTVVRTGHNYEITTVERSCNTAGYTLHKCLNCGESYMTNYVAAFDHTPGDWEIQYQPTCVREGSEVRKCLVCGDIVESKAIATSGHEYTASVVEPTCTSNGYVKYTCKYCSDTYNDNEIAKLGHDYQVTKVVRASTCTTQGLGYTQCTRCSSKSTAKLPLADHTPGEWQIITPATAASQGEKAQYCTVCNALVATESIPMISYTIEAKENSTAVVDEAKGIIYGVGEGASNLDAYISAASGTIEYVPTSNGFGTGTTVNLLNEQGEVVDSYKLVIFGDVDGDGYCDGCDYVLLSLYINWQYEFDDCRLYAADITNDGFVDAFDLSLSSLSGVQLYSAQQNRQLA